VEIIKPKTTNNFRRKFFMKLLQTIFACIFMLVATTTLAAKKEKELICHVGNEVGPGGEVYLDDPGCAPIEENGYFCPDAGKIDLIEVANANKHLNNPSHAFGGISDYLPADVGASGEGDEDSDGDGIDDGCQPPVLESCPCWTVEVLDSVDGIHSDGTVMSVYTQGAPNNLCQEQVQLDVWTTNYVWSNEADYHGPAGSGFCQSAAWSGSEQTRLTVQFNYYGEGDPANTLTQEELQTCSRQVQSCVARNNTP
jgi:hypothetical protein